MEFLEVPIFDDDFWKLLVRLLINLLVLTLIVWGCYHQHQKSRSYAFTFVLMNVMVFFICFTLKKIDLGLGMALGLFAIFAIIRYRTDAIRVKDMTYLFIVIGVAVINALSNKNTSYSELLLTNSSIILITFGFERLIRTSKLSKQDIVYDRMDLLKPECRPQLLLDIRERTGLDAERIKLSKIDFTKQSANITVYYESTDDALPNV